MAKELPFLNAALICEKVLQEKDNVNSAIRIVDRFSVSAPPNAPAGAVPIIRFTLYVSFQAPEGEGGSYQIGLQLLAPSGSDVVDANGRVVTPPLLSVLLDRHGENIHTGANLAVEMLLAVREYGDYQFVIKADRREVTRVRFTVQQQPLIASRRVLS